MINAIVEDAEQDRLFWEEWYLYEDEIHHHVLSLWRPPAYDEVFSALSMMRSTRRSASPSSGM